MATPGAQFEPFWYTWSSRMEKANPGDRLFPLADKLRPGTVDEFVGQEHLIGEKRIIRSFLEQSTLSSLIFFGPPGTGKTTLSRILVNQLQYPAMEFSATTAKITEIKEIMARSREVRAVHQKPLVVFVDEIHHFNKHSQDAFLPFVERGDIILLGTTIENPAYKINRSLLSRLKILEFFPLAPEQLRKILQRSLTVIREESDTTIDFSEPVQNILLNYSNGDARRLLNLVELIYTTLPTSDGISEQSVFDLIQNKVTAYDRSGDDRYHLISAFHKSVRNSDVDSSLFWLYRMQQGGEDPLYLLRRMIRIAVEDIGLADPDAARICLHAKDAYEYLGSPEGDLYLTQAAVYLATAPKSNSLYITQKRMAEVVEKYKNTPVPLSIINPSNFINRRKGAGDGYTYAHDVPEKTTILNTMPEQVEESNFYRPNELGFEKKISERMGYWDKIKEGLKKKPVD